MLDEKQDIYIVLKCLPTKYLLTQKEKQVTSWWRMLAEYIVFHFEDRAQLTQLSLLMALRVVYSLFLS